VRLSNIWPAMRPALLGTIILAVAVCVPLLAESQVVPPRPVQEVIRLRPVQENSLDHALAGAVPMIVTSRYIAQGEVASTLGSTVKDYVWIVPGTASPYKSTSVVGGFRGVFTRMTVTSTSCAAGMSTTYTLYKNGEPTSLQCRVDECGPGSFNWDVPIDVNDRWNIGVYLPKSATCQATGNGCAGQTPIITLMVRMGTN